MRLSSLTKLAFSAGLVALPFATPCLGDSPATNIPQVPFRIERKVVIIPTRVNGSQPLNLILDTGMGFDGVYLFHKECAKDMDTTGAITVRVPGAGSGEASTALMMENGRLTFGDLTADSQRVIIAQSEHTQSFRTDGVIGWTLFGHHTVEIDYDRELIFLHDPTAFKADTGWLGLPLILKENIPFLDAKLR